MHIGHSLPVVGPLCFVEDHYMFRRDKGAFASITLDILPDRADEGLSAPPGGAKNVLQYLDKRTIAREKYGRDTSVSLRQIVKTGHVSEPKPHEGFARAGYARQQDQPTRSRHAGVGGDFPRRAHCAIGIGH